MPSKLIRIAITVAIIGGAFGALMYTTLREDAAFYKKVDEVMVHPTEWYGKPMNLHGFVVDDTVERRPDSLDWQFRVKNGDSVVLATYTGVVPDTFKGGAEVVLTGKLAPEGFHATQVTAKCPSKYDPATGEGQ
jgi:cytochrome c-type biogenesis protein CcmE